MNKIKKLACAAIMLVMIATVFAGCHPQNETAMTIGDINIKTSTFVCAMMQADGEARTKVDEALKEAGQPTDNVKYTEQKVEETDYSTWVKNRATEILREYAAVDMKFVEKNLSLDQNAKSTVDTYSQFYWTNYGYQTLYSQNGISFETYKDFFAYSYKSSTYFLSIYGKGGAEPVDENTVIERIYKDYQIADVLEGAYTDQQGTAITEEAKKTLKEKFDGYEKRLNEGEDFLKIAKEYNPAFEEKQKDEKGPKDPYAQVLGAKDTYYEFEKIDDVSAIESGKAKVLETEKGLVLVVKRDIKSDDYYKESLYNSALSSLKQKDFESELKEYAATLSFKENTFATGRFKAKNLKYPTQQQQQQQQQQQ